MGRIKRNAGRPGRPALILGCLESCDHWGVQGQNLCTPEPATIALAQFEISLHVTTSLTLFGVGLWCFRGLMYQRAKGVETVPSLPI